MKNNLIKKEILKIFIKMKHLKRLNENTNLIAKGLIDSFDVIILVSLIEKKFSIKIPGEKITLNNFSNINKISKVVKDVY